MFDKVMYGVAAVVAAALGAGAVVVVVLGVRQGFFPFRPRGSGAAPDGYRHGLHRADEPILFWLTAGGLSGVGLVMLWLAGWIAVKLLREAA